MMETIGEFLYSLLAGIGKLLLVAVIVWMIGLIILLFRELFRAGDLNIRTYLYKVWKMLLVCNEFIAYGSLIVGPIMAYRTEGDERLGYIMLSISGLILSGIYIYIRKRVKGIDLFKFNQK
ncbi:hypothetical protein IC619_005605 [Hazenella sp. IB182353]|uniref:hypothetical protein n=1 Tax=Polycladospora coralii TaxID=2771432 RepID=UPI001746A906|nr:hypothetical protein [Polycladospora coralii]MBS7529973.1 hypothetical protein [Polycladospora coralii]